MAGMRVAPDPVASPHGVSAGTRVAGALTLVLALVAYIYAPLLSSGLLGADHRTLLAVEQAAAGPAPAAWYAPVTQARPLATLSLLASRALWTEAGRWTGAEALPLWLEHLALALLAAWGLHGLLRRALVPWLGPDPAKAAAHTGSALLLVHPLCVASVGNVASRGDWIALAAGAWAARAFLTARQERRGEWSVFSGVATLVAAFASPLAWLFPPLVAGLEYLSARRHRPRARRARTAATALLAFGALVSLEWAGRWRFASGEWRAFAPAPTTPTPALVLEKLGVVLLPVDTYGIGSVGYLFAALAVLVAVHPGFVAARAAPRLWGRILLGWGLSLAAAMAPAAGTRVPPGTLQGSELLLGCALVMSVGYGISSTALSGWRRTVLPVVVGGLFALLGRAVSLPREEAALAVAGLQAELTDAARDRDWATTLVVLDPPEAVAGVDALGGGLEALVAEPFLPKTARARGVDLRVLGVTRAALRAWVREPEFQELRAAGAALLVRPEELGALDRTARVVVDVPPPGVGDPTAIWHTEGRTPSGLVLDPLQARFFRVSALPEAGGGEPPIIRWSSTRDLGHDAVVTGAWATSGHAPLAVFDLESSLPWLCGGRVRSVWFPGELTSIVSARATAQPPPLAGEVVPRPLGDDWSFDVSEVEPAVGPTYWRLTLLDLARLEARELSPESELDVDGRLRFLGADRTAREVLEGGGGPIAWTLDRRTEAVTLARARGRVAAENGALPVRQE